jgi:hypothetical protein
MLRGWRTTEFWMTLGLIVGQAVQAIDLPGWAAAAAAGAYALSRGIAKAFGGKSGE